MTACADVTPVPKPQSYYLEQAVRRLERFETASGQVPEQGGVA
jgi:hypothetical protein